MTAFREIHRKTSIVAGARLSANDQLSKRKVTFLIMLSLLSSTGSAQLRRGPEYSVTFLNDGAYTRCYARSISNDRSTIIGTVSDYQSEYATTWRYPFLDFTALSLNFSYGSAVNSNGSILIGNSGDNQYLSGWQSRGLIWFGGPSDFQVFEGSSLRHVMTHLSCVSLNGLIQGGNVSERLSGEQIGERAAIWHGADQCTILHPNIPQANSRVDAVSGDGSVQVGSISLPFGGNHGMIWHGTPESALRLTPQGYTESYCFGVSADGITQVGFVANAQGVYAALWRGVADSLLLLNPTGEPFSQCNAISPNGRWQIGNCNDSNRAVRWAGTASTMLDLGVFLPQGYTPIRVTGVNDAGDVVGAAVEIATGRVRPVLWHRNWSDAGQLDKGSHPVIKITKGPWIEKDIGTNRWMLKFETKQVFYSSQCTVDALVSEANWERQPLQARQTTDISGTQLSWSFDLEAATPRFNRRMSFTIETNAYDSVGSMAETKELVVPVPVIIVKGIFSNADSDGYDDGLAAKLCSFSYQRADDSNATLPTVFGLRYDPVLETLDQNSLSLSRLVDYVVGPATYFSKVDLVAHSKGGLVCRTYLSHFNSVGKIRKVVMACTPHTGAAASILGYQIFSWARLTFAELFPTSDWYRETLLQSFGPHHDGLNTVLIDLNKIDMPPRSELRYYLLFGKGWPTHANYTSIFGFEETDGDGIALLDWGVPSWSARGYEVINSWLNPPAQGALIPAFRRNPPAEPPLMHEADNTVGLPYPHVGFLSAAANTIYQILRQD